MVPDIFASIITNQAPQGKNGNASEKTACAEVEIKVPEDAKKYKGSAKRPIYFNNVDKNADAAKQVIEVLKKIDDKSGTAECQADVDEYNKLTPEQKTKAGKKVK